MTGRSPQPGAADALALPDYGTQSLSGVLPGVAAVLGIDTGLPAIELPAANRVCIVLLDGLGERQLGTAARCAPFLSRMQRRVLDAGCPTTTATSMGTFGTGLPPGSHGMAGYLVLDPDRDELLNELKWHPDTDPLAWQPLPTVFEQLAVGGVSSIDVGNPEFDGSGLTVAAHRGAGFVGVKRLHSRVDAAVAALADPAGPRLVYLYWGEIDAAGHRHGWQSQQWRRALQHADREIDRLARALPAGTLLLVTADHGMVDAADVDRIDLADRPDLAGDVRIVGGEPRLAQLYCQPGSADSIAAGLSAELGDKAWVVTLDGAEAAGWFGKITPRVRRRFGDVLVAARGLFTCVDSRVMSASELGLIGYHGSLTPDEQEIPLGIELT